MHLKMSLSDTSGRSPETDSPFPPVRLGVQNSPVARLSMRTTSVRRRNDRLRLAPLITVCASLLGRRRLSPIMSSARATEGSASENAPPFSESQSELQFGVQGRCDLQSHGRAAGSKLVPTCPYQGGAPRCAVKARCRDSARLARLPAAAQPLGSIRNQQVVGSSPTAGSIQNQGLA